MQSLVLLVPTYVSCPLPTLIPLRRLGPDCVMYFGFFSLNLLTMTLVPIRTIVVIVVTRLPLNKTS